MSSHFKSFMLNKLIIQYINQIEKLVMEKLCKYAKGRKSKRNHCVVFAKFITFTIKTVFARL